MHVYAQIITYNTQGEIKTTPLCVASQNGHLHVASLLIKKKADVEYETEVSLLRCMLQNNLLCCF